MYVVDGYDWFDVGYAIGDLILQRCQLEDAFSISSLLDAPLEQLRARGFPVDRILQVGSHVQQTDLRRRSNFLSHFTLLILLLFSQNRFQSPNRNRNQLHRHLPSPRLRRQHLPSPLLPLIPQQPRSQQVVGTALLVQHQAPSLPILPPIPVAKSRVKRIRTMDFRKFCRYA